MNSIRNERYNEQDTKAAEDIFPPRDRVVENPSPHTFLKGIKEDRIKQWGNNGKTPRGWDRYRASTFLEVIGAKIDRALQAQELIRLEFNDRNLKNPDTAKIQKLEFDGIDSLKDAYNYLGKLLEFIDKDPEYYLRNNLP
jgi:hypothetical protein